MTAEGISPVEALLASVSSPQCWDVYTRRSEVLSSPDPRNWKAIDFPVEVALELTNCCNLRCVMCPVPNLKRKRGFMDKSVFEKVVADVSGESGFLFLPQGFGESLLHAQWRQLVDCAHAAKINPIIVLSNGMLLSAEKIGALNDKVDIVVVTVDGCTAETYESIRVNGSLETVTKNIENLLKMRHDGGTPRLILRIIKMKDTQEEIEAFRVRWAGKIGKGDLVQVSDCIDWAGSIPYRGVNETQVRIDPHPCRMLWKNLTVYHDGRVSPCCYDAEGELIIGNVLDQSLREIWNGDRLRNLRNLHLSHQFGEIAICSRCRNWQ